jgi:hypothetical protein
MGDGLTFNERDRARQSKRVMAVVPGLLDAWDSLSNDVKSDIRVTAPTLAQRLDALDRAVED